MLKRIIKRPVFATVISILLLILGIVGMTNLPITKFPDIAPPTVIVSSVYPGANAETVARTVAPPIEEAINGVEDMDYITSTASNGSLLTTVIFKQGTDPDQAAVNVQNRVAQATSQLPAEVNQIGVTTLKRQTSILAMITLYSEEDKGTSLFVENYAKINVIPELKRIQGVGDAFVFGNGDYSMRVWMDPGKMAANNLTPQEVAAAIQAANVEAAPGRFGELSKEAIDYTIRYRGKFSEPQDYENISIRATPDGQVLRLKDIARIEFGSYDYSVATQYNKKPGVMVALFQTAGSNANEIEIAARHKMEELSKTFPSGLKYEIVYSSKSSLDQSMTQLIRTFIEAFILVFLVVFVFLQDLRSTLIPAIAVPVSIVGTFFFMSIFGFSINLLTLFALVLAIGIVVDDAIVVVEAVHAKMETDHLNPRAATMSAMSEITGAIVSITLVMAAVFVPVAFMQGSTGVFFKQFALTLAIAIGISAINALTLSPALCAIILRQPKDTDSKKKVGFKEKFFAGFNAAFERLTSGYVRSVHFFAKHKWLAFSGLAVVIALVGWMFVKTPTGFIPDEDQSFLMATVTLPPGATQYRTAQIVEQATSILEKYPATEDLVAINGVNMLNFSTSTSSAVFMVKLKPMGDRGKTENLDQITMELNGALSQIKGASFFVLGLPTIPGFGNTSGLELVLQDRTAGSLENFSNTAQQYIGAMMQRPEISMAFTTFSAAYPQYELVVNEAKAKQLGVDVANLMTVMQGYYGSLQASDFNRFGKYYRVVIQSDPKERAEASSLDNIMIKNNFGQMVPVSAVASLKLTQGPEAVNHFNMFPSIDITAMAAPGFSTGQAIKAAQEVGAQVLPNGFTYDFKGMSREELTSGKQANLIFLLSVIFVYFLLSAQYESYLVPFSILIGIPTGLLGVFVGVSIGDLENNIYVQVALIMLIGLLAKNAILIVEFALQRRRAGMSIVESAVEGAKVRLRPILMTSLAFIAGLTPLIFSTGPSAIGNHSIGFAAVFGMLFGTALGVFVIPILYIVFQWLQEKISGDPVDDSEWEYESLHVS